MFILPSLVILLILVLLLCFKTLTKFLLWLLLLLTKIELSKPQCHFCEVSPGLVIFAGERSLCPKCFRTLYAPVSILPDHLPERLKAKHVIDPVDTLDFMMAKIMAFYLANNMTVSNVARQLGITRATIYAKLKKYNLLSSRPVGPVTLNISALDDFQSGASKRGKAKVTECILPNSEPVNIDSCLPNKNVST